MPKKTTKKVAGGPTNPRRNPRGRPKGGKLVTDEHIAQMIEWVAQGVTPWNLKTKLYKLLGTEVSPSCFNRQMAKVRAYLREMWTRPQEDMRVESLSFYAEVRGNSRAMMQDRLMAASRIDSILGLDARFTQGLGNESVEDFVERINDIRRGMRESVPAAPETIPEPPAAKKPAAARKGEK